MNKFKLSLIVVLVLFLTLPVITFADLTLNIIAVNPTDESGKEVDVKFYLPRELEPEDVVDTGELELDYDVDKEVYFVHNKINFNAKESKTFKVKIKDVWIISQEEIDILKKQLEGNLAMSEEKPYFGEAEVIAGKIDSKLDYIFAQQKFYSEDVNRRIEEFRAYNELLKQLKEQVYNLEYFKHNAEALSELNQAKTVKFVLEVKNPIDGLRKLKQKHYLPIEVRAEDVVEKRGFEVRFDEKKQRSFLSKEDEFNPGETKKYEILIRDIWQFPYKKVDGLKERVDQAMEDLEMIGLDEFMDTAKYLFEEIGRKTDLITASEQQVLPIKEHIGLHRVNQKRFNEAEEDLERIIKMIAIAQAKKLEEMQDSTVSNVLSKLKALRGLQALSEAIFKKGISVNLTWKIIIGAMGFVAFFTILHFFIWAKRSKLMGEENTKDGKVKIVPKPGEEKEEEEA
ncbi:MAG: hypothetical protein KAR05_09670 [Candidatus Omnitrophica bacterium]|nr:hypothetical protein [Candidatus Omnitrophota bacterium]